jgi:hypothetical protein
MYLLLYWVCCSFVVRGGKIYVMLGKIAVAQWVARLCPTEKKANLTGRKVQCVVFQV